MQASYLPGTGTFPEIIGATQDQYDYWFWREAIATCITQDQFLANSTIQEDDRFRRHRDAAIDLDSNPYGLSHSAMRISCELMHARQCCRRGTLDEAIEFARIALNSLKVENVKSYSRWADFYSLCAAIFEKTNQQSLRLVALGHIRDLYEKMGRVEARDEVDNLRIEIGLEEASPPVPHVEKPVDLSAFVLMQPPPLVSQKRATTRL